MAGGGGGNSWPGNYESIPGIPSNFVPIIWEEFSTLNTKPLRPAIGRDEAYVLDGWMPLGPSNARILPGTGQILWSASGVNVVWFQFYNIYDTEYLVVLTSDGALTQVNVATGGTTAIGGAGTITNPSTIMGFSQWGSQYLILSKDQNNGYWLWDGTLLYTAGTIAPLVNIDSGGMNYPNGGVPAIILYDTTTTLLNSAQFSPPVLFSSVILDGSVTQILVTSQGDTFAVDDFVGINR
jgi:hypothetical protein